jgi:hypothetical protein
MEKPDEDGAGYDYVSPGLREIEAPEKQFPDATRRTHPRIEDDPHAWYHHKTSTQNGYLNRDESILLYNNARKFEGKAALEIGSASGWSAWHALKAGVGLCMCDPGFSDASTLANVVKSLGEFAGRFTLTAVGSPAGALEFARYNFPFSFVLIDGNHDLPWPMIDAAAVHYLCAGDAIIMLHDCWSQGVLDALKLLRAFEWSTGVYRTSGLFGVAWRGSAEPVKHIADVAMPARNVPKEFLLS